MKYHAPYGSSDPDASYVDRNTPGATSGSRVPAPAIETPQREIVDVISKAGLVPADDLQLAEAIQSGILNFAVAAGSANAITTSLSPDLTAYKNGLSVNLKITTPNTGAATINIDGLGAKQIVNADGGALSAGDLTGVATLIYDGAKFVVSNVSQATETARGVVELASATEVATGSDLSRPAAVGRTAVAIQNQIYQYGSTAGGTVNALAVTLTPAPAALTEGLGIVFVAAGSNTGVVTVNVNGLGAKSLFGPSGQQLSAGDLYASRMVYAVYNGVSFRMIGSLSATEAAEGAVELASAAETAAGADLARLASVGRLANQIQTQGWQFASVAAGSTVNAYNLAMTPKCTALTVGLGLFFVATGTNTAAVTLNVDGLGPENLRGAFSGNVPAGSLVQFRIVYAIYDGVNFNIIGEVPASETSAGLVELASTAEVTAGVDLTRPAAVGRMSDVIQSGVWNYAIAAGTANAITTNIVPTPTLSDGMVINLKITASNTGATTLNISGGGAHPIVGADNTALNAGDLSSGDIVQLVYSNAINSWIFRGRQKGQLIGIRVFGAPGASAYTPTPGTGSVLVEVQGGGGGGGNAAPTSAGQISAGAGGAGGGYARKYITSGFSGQTVTVGVGGAAATTGGTSSFGSLCSSVGGTGGSSGPAQSSSVVAVVGGATGGTATGGDVNARGGHGKYAVYQSAQLGGEGGNSYFGSGGPPTSGTSSGNAGSSPGSGGSGANAGSGVAGGGTGGTGAAGVVIIWEFA